MTNLTATDDAANWCYDTRCAATPEPAPSQPHQGWPQLFAAVLDRLRPFPDAHAAIRQLTREVLAHLPAV